MEFWNKYLPRYVRTNEQCDAKNLQIYSNHAPTPKYNKRCRGYTSAARLVYVIKAETQQMQQINKQKNINFLEYVQASKPRQRPVPSPAFFAWRT